MIYRRIILAAAVVIMTSTLTLENAAAQSAYRHSVDNGFNKAATAQLSLRVPFGSQARAKKNAYDPRLSFGVSRYTPQTRTVTDWQLRGGFYETQSSEISLTFSQQPVLLLNGQEFMFRPDDQIDLGQNTKTAGKVALVAGAAAAVVVGVLLIRVAACGGDGEDEKC